MVWYFIELIEIKEEDGEQRCNNRIDRIGRLTYIKSGSFYQIIGLLNEMVFGSFPTENKRKQQPEFHSLSLCNLIKSCLSMPEK